MKGTEGSKMPCKYKADFYQNSQLTRQATYVKWMTKRWHFTWVEVKFIWVSPVTLHTCNMCAVVVVVVVVVLRVCSDSWRSSRGFSRWELLSRSGLCAVCSN